MPLRLIFMGTHGISRCRRCWNWWRTVTRSLPSIPAPAKPGGRRGLTLHRRRWRRGTAAEHPGFHAEDAEDGTRLRAFRAHDADRGPSPMA